MRKSTFKPGGTMLISVVPFVVVILFCFVLLSLREQPYWGDRVLSKIFHVNRHHGYFYWWPTLYGLIIISATSMMLIYLFNGLFIWASIILIVLVIAVVRFIKSVTYLNKTKNIKFK